MPFFIIRLSKQEPPDAPHQMTAMADKTPCETREAASAAAALYPDSEVLIVEAETSVDAIFRTTGWKRPPH